MITKEDFIKKYSVFFEMLKITNAEYDRDYVIEDDVVHFKNYKKNPLFVDSWGETDQYKENIISQKLTEFSLLNEELLIPKMKCSTHNVSIYYRHCYKFKRVLFDDFYKPMYINIYNNNIESIRIKANTLKNVNKRDEIYYHINSSSVKEIDIPYYMHGLVLYEIPNLKKINHLGNLEVLILNSIGIVCNNTKEKNSNQDYNFDLVELINTSPKMSKISNFPEKYKIYSSSGLSYILNNEISTYDNKMKIPFVYSSDSNAIKKINRLKKDTPDPNKNKKFFADMAELNAGKNNSLFKKIMTKQFDKINEDDKHFLNCKDRFGNSILTYCVYPESFDVIAKLGYKFKSENIVEVRKDLKQIYQNHVLLYKSRNIPLFRKFLNQQFNKINEDDKKFLYSKDIEGEEIFSYCFNPKCFEVLYNLNYKFKKEDKNKIDKKFHSVFEKYLILNTSIKNKIIPANKNTKNGKFDISRVKNI